MQPLASHLPPSFPLPQREQDPVATPPLPGIRGTRAPRNAGCKRRALRRPDSHDGQGSPTPPGEPCESIITLASQTGIADATITKTAKTTTALCAE